MKRAAEYRRKLKRLWRGASAAQPGEIPPGVARVHFMIEAILQADTTRRQAAAAVDPLREEYVDLNELRVSPIKDIIDCMGRDLPPVRDKAEMIVTVLNNLFLRVNDISLDWLADLPPRELRRTLTELGLGPYPAGAVAWRLFGVHAVPVDETLVDCLKADGYVHPSSDPAEVQAFLEKLITPKSAAAAIEALRNYCEKRSKTLPPRPAPPPPPPALEVSEEEQVPRGPQPVEVAPPAPSPSRPAAKAAAKKPPAAKPALGAQRREGPAKRTAKAGARALKARIKARRTKVGRRK